MLITLTFGALYSVVWYIFLWRLVHGRMRTICHRFVENFAFVLCRRFCCAFDAYCSEYYLCSHWS